eukprot:ANDGO_02120.mRNA.1 hypothetical protein
MNTSSGDDGDDTVELIASTGCASKPGAVLLTKSATSSRVISPLLFFSILSVVLLMMLVVCATFTALLYFRVRHLEIEMTGTVQRVQSEMTTVLRTAGAELQDAVIRQLQFSLYNVSVPDTLAKLLTSNFTEMALSVENAAGYTQDIYYGASDSYMHEAGIKASLVKSIAAVFQQLTPVQLLPAMRSIFDPSVLDNNAISILANLQRFIIANTDLNKWISVSNLCAQFANNMMQLDWSGSYDDGGSWDLNDQKYVLQSVSDWCTRFSGNAL